MVIAEFSLYLTGILNIDATAYVQKTILNRNHHIRTGSIKLYRSYGDLPAG